MQVKNVFKSFKRIFITNKCLLRSCLKISQKIYYQQKIIAVDFSQRNISSKVHGFSQNYRINNVWLKPI